MLNIAVFGSGAGSNFMAILTAIQQGNLPAARVSLVLSNNSGAGILGIARANALPAIHLSRKQFPDERSFADTVISTLRDHGANFIALAGYMKHVPPEVVAAYRNRIVNIHPALLPRFGGAGMYGMRVHEAVLASGATMSGATVHYVDEEYDSGPVVLQQTVPVLPGDTPGSLAARVLAAEHQLYPAAIGRIARSERAAEQYHN
jgi:phosphoribosylglycinamide formyltransferase-1